MLSVCGCVSLFSPVERKDEKRPNCEELELLQVGLTFRGIILKNQIIYDKMGCFFASNEHPCCQLIYHCPMSGSLKLDHLEESGALVWIYFIVLWCYKLQWFLRKASFFRAGRDFCSVFVLSVDYFLSDSSTTETQIMSRRLLFCFHPSLLSFLFCPNPTLFLLYTFPSRMTESWEDFPRDQTRGIHLQF